jgi:DNA mismatch repair protein MutS
MAGKSTYLRQCALIAIMAQMGSFVPAAEAEVGIIDRVFCRVGAQDNLARGESTFLVEMNETAFILNTATERSLVIMDEVGRGTGTLDGLSIAHAVCDDLLERLRCRTLFATHYHELVNISHSRLVNRSLEVAEEDGVIIFRRRLVEGPSADSYGLQVARLAGLPAAVLTRAADYLRELKAEKDGNEYLTTNPPENARETLSVYLAKKQYGESADDALCRHNSKARTNLTNDTNININTNTNTNTNDNTNANAKILKDKRHEAPKAPDSEGPMLFDM